MARRPEEWSTGPKGSKGSKGSKAAHVFENTNRLKVLGFLYYYSDLYETGGAPAVADVGGSSRTGSSDSSGPGPLRGYIMDRAESEEASATHRALLEGVEALRRERWELWLLLEPLYFRDDNNPSRLDEWRVEAARGDVGSRMMLGQHNDAVRFVQRRAEEYLTQRVNTSRSTSATSYSPLLDIDLPVRGRGPAEAHTKRRRQEALDLFTSELAGGISRGLTERDARAEAVKIVSEQKGYSVQEVRAIAREMEEG